jgi:hypothetical protein
MSDQARSVALFDHIKLLARRFDARALASRVTADAGAAAREVWAILNAVENLRGELRRMADECESTDPERAACLRKVANRHWTE